MAEVAAVVLGLAFLHIFYKAISAKWPTSYYSIGSKTNQVISKNLIAYLLFRFGPIYVTCVFVGAVLARNDRTVLFSVILIAGLHAFLTSGRALLGLLRTKQVSKRPLVSILHIGILILAVLVGILAAITAPLFNRYVPSANDLPATLWTALFAGVIGAFLLHVTQVSEPDTHAALGKSRSRIPDDLWRAAEDAAYEVGAEPRLVHAFMLVENMQRPSWTRQLERAAGKLFGRGSYGPLQVTADGPQADLAALKDAVRIRFSGRSVPRYEVDWGQREDTQWLEFFARSYNPDESYVQDILTAYYWIENPSTEAIASTEARAHDNLPQIEVLHFGSAGGILTVAGRVASADGELTVRLINSTREEIYRETLALNNRHGTRRSSWKFSTSIPDNAVNVQLWAGSTAGPGTPDDLITLPVRVSE